MGSVFVIHTRHYCICVVCDTLRYMTELNTNSQEIEKPIRGEGGKLLPGVVLNPAGRPKGSRNFYTDFSEAIKRIKDEKTGEQITEIDIIAIGMKKMLKGDERFEGLYKDLLDRVYGRATQPVETTSKVEITKVSEEHIAIAEKYEEELKKTL